MERAATERRHRERWELLRLRQGTGADEVDWRVRVDIAAWRLVKANAISDRDRLCARVHLSTKWESNAE